MNQALKITDAEYYIMKTLWKNAPLGASDIIEVLKAETNWNPKTIHTLISRLVTKGAVGVHKNTSYNQYYPLVAENDYQRLETKSFIKKVYNGSIHHLVANFIKDEALTKEEIDELKKLLDE